MSAIMDDFEISMELDRLLKARGPVYRASRQYAADPCQCAHPRRLHHRDGGCVACCCDIPADLIAAKVSLD